jgi:hypothetical protein
VTELNALVCSVSIPVTIFNQNKFDIPVVIRDYGPIVENASRPLNRLNCTLSAGAICGNSYACKDEISQRLD